MSVMHGVWAGAKTASARHRCLCCGHQGRIGVKKVDVCVQESTDAFQGGGARPKRWRPLYHGLLKLVFALIHERLDKTCLIPKTSIDRADSDTGNSSNLVHGEGIYTLATHEIF